MGDEQTTDTGTDESALPTDSTPEADDAAAARVKDYEQTVEWNEQRSDSKSTGA